MSERSRMWGGTPDRWTPTFADRSGRHPIAPVRPEPYRAAPSRWETHPPVEPDRAEPTDGRHAFDRDAALTPIFTSLRRGAGRRPRVGAPPLRLAPEPVDVHRGDPPTAPLPVVPALHALDPYPSGGYGAAPVDPYPTRGWAPVDPYATGGYHPAGHPPVPAPSPNETTAVWYVPDDPMAYSPVTDTGRHHRRLAPAGW